MRRLVLLGVCCAALLGARSPAVAAPLPDGPRLAFTAMWSLQREGMRLHTVGLDNRRAPSLLDGARGATTPQILSPPSWSPDGAWLAFAGSKGRRVGIYLVRADGTGLRFVRGSGESARPVFSPDGSRIAFARMRLTLGKEKGKDKGGGFFGATAWVVDVAGGRPIQLTRWRNGIEYVPSSFTPDGSAVAISVLDSRFAEAEALLVPVGGGRTRFLAREFSEPVYSPDGSQIALIGHRASGNPVRPTTRKDLFVMSADGKAIRALTRTPGRAETAPSWDPSGQRISFNSTRQGDDPVAALFDELFPFGNAIRQVNSDGTCAKTVFSSRRMAVYGAAWRPGPGREAGPIAC